MNTLADPVLTRQIETVRFTALRIDVETRDFPVFDIFLGKMFRAGIKKALYERYCVFNELPECNPCPEKDKCRFYALQGQEKLKRFFVRIPPRFNMELAENGKSSLRVRRWNGKPLNHKGKLRVRGRFKTAICAFSMGISINFGRIYRHLTGNPELGETLGLIRAERKIILTNLVQVGQKMCSNYLTVILEITKRHHAKPAVNSWQAA